MQFEWLEYSKDYAALVESWMDDEAKRGTGCDDGWTEYLDYWLNDPGTRYGENFWCKLVIRDGDPAAVIAVGEENGTLCISEIVAAPEKRGQGIASAALTELLAYHEELLGKRAQSAFAVIYPSNTASQKAFEKAGFRFESAHPDGDAWYYRRHLSRKQKYTCLNDKCTFSVCIEEECGWGKFTDLPDIFCSDS